MAFQFFFFSKKDVMDPSEFPPNKGSHPKREEPKNLTRVTSAEAVRRKKPLRRQLAETFVGGDAKTALTYVIFDVMIPAAKDMISEASSQGIDKLIYGDSRRKPTSQSGPPSGPTGYVSYNRHPMQSRQTAPQRTLSRRNRAQHDFDELVLVTRLEAEDVIAKLYEVVSQYGTATVADLYELVGEPSTHTDNKWGWTDLRGAGVSRVRTGFLLDLPAPEPLD